ncbi:MAG: SOS response-associated peptidase [Pirellulaceae bacterium]
MCGRFTLRTPMSVLLEQFGIPLEPPWRPRYNIAPTQLVAALRFAEAEDQRLASGWGLARLRWGLIPSWAKDPSIGSRMINARGETVHEKPSFRAAFRRRPCLILADGYYEWQARKGAKQPFHIRLASQGPMTFAGLWEHWKSGTDVIESCTIITTEANSLTRPIHDRMPVIIGPEDRSEWLSTETAVEQRLALIQPWDAATMEAVPVSTHVNRPGNDDPSCLDEVSVEPD